MKTNTHYPIIIIGGSIAAIGAIKAISSKQSSLNILLISGEDRLPYKRTQINKNIVNGFSKDQFKIADLNWYKHRNTDLVQDFVISIDRLNKSVTTIKGQTFTYNKLLLTTGVSSKLPTIDGLTSQDYLKVQNAADVDLLMSLLPKGENFLIIGSGVEGIETADQLHRMNKKVVIIDRHGLPMRKLLPEIISQKLKETMLTLGLNYHSNTTISNIHKTNEGKYQTTIDNINYLFDGIISCAGTQPNIDLPSKSGIVVNKGVIVNDYFSTNDPYIYAAGDVAEHKNNIITGLWHAAEYQGGAAALNMINIPTPFINKPFRLKTEVFGMYLFSAAFESNDMESLEKHEEKSGIITRILYYANDKLKAMVMLNDGQRAALYQQALMEEWTASEVKTKIPLLPALSFNFAPTFK